MGTPEWRTLRGTARASISRAGFAPLLFEDIPVGQVPSGSVPGDLGVEMAKRSDMVVAIVGSTVTEPFKREIEEAFDRTPAPPIGVFFDGRVARDERAMAARAELGERGVFGDFQSNRELDALLSRFLAARSAEAMLNRATPRVIHDEELQVIPGKEIRRRFLLLAGDSVTATAVATEPRRNFHFAFTDEAAYIRLTEDAEWSTFEVFKDKFAFRAAVQVEEAGFYYAVVRRPWWFQVGRARVTLTVTVTRRRFGTFGE